MKKVLHQMKNLINHLGARALGTPSEMGDTISDFEKKVGMLFPVELVSLLKAVGSAVVFNRGAKFIPTHSTGREDEAGCLNVEVFYGGQSNQNGLQERNFMLRCYEPI